VGGSLARLLFRCCYSGGTNQHTVVGVTVVVGHALGGPEGRAGVVVGPEGEKERSPCRVEYWKRVASALVASCLSAARTAGRRRLVSRFPPEAAPSTAPACAISQAWRWSEHLSILYTFLVR
jgi:hypothetical protein